MWQCCYWKRKDGSIPTTDDRRHYFAPKNNRVLIVVPTRELAEQVKAMADRLAQFTDIETVSIVGGLSWRCRLHSFVLDLI